MSKGISGLSKRKKCFEISLLQKLSWETGNIETSLDAVFEHVTKEATEAINWYRESNRSKKRWARRLRGAAILIASLAGISPMLSQIWEEIPATLASILLGIAGAIVILDRFYGFTSAWIRYIKAEMAIDMILREFNMDWEIEKASWKQSEPNDEQLEAMLTRAKNFLLQVKTIVEQETKVWAAEFQSTLKQIDERMKTTDAATRRGGLNIVVTNGDECEDGWKLSVDEGMGKTYRGKTAAISDLSPGMHKVEVVGTIEGEIRRKEVSVFVSSGGIEEVKLTLN